MIEAVFAIVGTIIGFALSEIATAIRERRSEKRQAKSVRTLLKLEMTLNLQRLQGFWAKVSLLPETRGDFDDQKRALGRQLIDEPLPEFEREAFESQLSHLAGVLREQEVVQVLRFYDRLRRVESVRAELTVSLSEQREEIRVATKGGAAGGMGRMLAYSPPTPFNEKAPRLWDEVEQLVSQIQSEGNPFDS